MKSLAVLAVMTVGMFGISPSSLLRDLVEITSSCGKVWHIDMDQVPDHVTTQEFVDYVQFVDDVICD